MYLKSRVKIPDVHGKLTRLRRGNVTYIKYEYDRYYDPEKKYTYPQRATIGKLCVDDDTMMIPNEAFLKYFPDATLSGMEDRADRSSCLRIGTYAVIHKIIRDYTLDEMLGRFFSERDLALLLYFFFKPLNTYSKSCHKNSMTVLNHCNRNPTVYK